LLVSESQIEIYFVGKDFFANKIASKNMHFYENYELFAVDFKKQTVTGNTILIKGSRGMALERTLEMI
jgi:UDP-N-acetylmuramoyl-tripeptide--D-alanyl-D-alanine ligase